jgi:hypothetical protein
MLDDDSGHVGAAAFMFRETDTDGLSCNWLEHISAPRTEQLNRIRSVIRLKLRRSHRLAIVNCGVARQRIRDAVSHELSIIEDPLPPEGEWAADPSHALIEPPPADLLEQVAVELAVVAKAEAAIP